MANPKDKKEEVYENWRGTVLRFFHEKYGADEYRHDMERMAEDLEEPIED